MWRRVLSFGAVSIVECALLVVATDTIIHAHGFRPCSTATSQCRFNPSGFFYIKGEIPKGLEDFSHIALWTLPSQVSRPPAGVYGAGGEVHQFSVLTAAWSQEKNYFLFDFATAPAKGISYRFTGRFLEDCGYESHVKDPAKVVAEGRLARLKDGQQMAEATVQFTYSPALRDKNTELMMAAGNGDLPLVRTLLAQGTDVGARGPLDGKTVLHFAVQSGNAGVVTTLLAAGADPKAKDRNGSTPLMFAAGTSVEMVNDLLQAGVDVNAKESGGNTALIYAVLTGKAGVVDALIRAGADVNATGADGETVLMKAASGSSDLVKLLIAAKANVNLKAGSGRTALINAALQDEPASVEALIRAGADTNARDSTGWTPLMYAAGLGFLGSAKVLLSEGANVNAKDKDGKTALMHAVQVTGHSRLDSSSLETTGYLSPEMVKLLIVSGADLQAVDNNGSTALSMAGTAKVKERIISALKEAGAT